MRTSGKEIHVHTELYKGMLALDVLIYHNNTCRSVCWLYNIYEHLAIVDEW